MAKSKRKSAKHTVSLDYKVELVAVAEMKPHAENYHGHPDDQLEHIVESLRANGFYRNVVLARDNTILAGHGVVEAAKKLKLAEVPAIRLDINPNSTKALKVLAGDNEISKMAEINDRALTEVLKKIADSDEEGLLGTGYDKQMLAALAMVTRPRGEIAGMDEAAAWAGMPEFGEKDEQIKITVLFRNKTDREKFVAEKKLQITTYKTQTAWTTWWPPKKRDDLESVRFETTSNGAGKTKKVKKKK